MGAIAFSLLNTRFVVTLEIVSFRQGRQQGRQVERSSAGLILLLPATGEHIIQCILEGAAVHVDQTALLLRFGVANDGYKAEVSVKRQ
jgi:hypothetical protein